MSTKSISESLPTVYQYLDFREYLEAFYKIKKSIDTRFSHGRISSLLGQPNSRSYFSNILKGRINVSPKTVQLFISKVLKLDKSEGDYFRHLVYYAQAKEPEEKEFYFDQIIRLNHTPHELIPPERYAFFSEVHHTTIRALLDVENFKLGQDEAILAKKLRFNVPPKKIKESIELLMQLGLIQNTDTGLKPTNQIIKTKEKVRNHLVQKFQIKCLEQGKHAIVESNGETGRTSTQTLSISQKAYENILQKVEQLQTEIRAIAHKDKAPASGVYQVNLQVFPQMKEE